MEIAYRDNPVQIFLDQLAEVLEVPSIGLDDDFRLVPLWSSLTGFSVMVMLDLEYGVGLSVEELKVAKTVRDIAEKVGVFAAERRP